MTAEPEAPAARGVARVHNGAAARGVAAVPGALTVPPVGLPSEWGQLPPPAVLFERRPSWAGPTLLTETPPLRTAVPDAETEKPDDSGAPAEEERDDADPVPRKGFLRRLGRRAALPAATAVAAAFVTGTTYLALADGFGGSVSDLGRWGASAAVTFPDAVQGAGNAGRPSGDPFGSGAAVAKGAPTRVRVAAIDLDSTLEMLHLGTGGALQPPKEFARAGWYADGTAPGDIGPAVIAGHVDSKAGPAVFYRLRELTAGDKIEVVRGGVTLTFTVTRTAWYPKTKFPTSTVYGPTPDRQLRLITCGGVFDHRLRSYKDNLVVYAVAG